MPGSLPQDHVMAGSGEWEPDAAGTASVRRIRWRRTIMSALIIAIMLGGGLAAVVANSRRQSGTGATSSGYISAPGLLSTMAPDQRLPGPQLEGELIDGSDFRSDVWAGKIVVINFWGSWCAPCRAETPELVRVARARHGGGVAFLGVDVRDNRASAQAFLAQYRVPYPSLFDESNETALSFRGLPPNAVPTTFVLDKRGRIAAVALGRITGEQLSKVLTTLDQEIS